jgi:hypothetical protein
MRKRSGGRAVTTLFEVDDDADEMTAFVVRMHGLAFKFHLQTRSGARGPSWRGAAATVVSFWACTVKLRWISLAAR